MFTLSANTILSVIVRGLGLLEEYVEVAELLNFNVMKVFEQKKKIQKCLESAMVSYIVYNNDIMSQVSQILTARWVENLISPPSNSITL